MPYPEEYRRRLVELVRSGRSPEDLALEFEPCAPTIRKWARKAGVPPLTGGPRRAFVEPEVDDKDAEIKKLRREVARLREEREILKKAAAWVCHEQRERSSA